MAQKVNEANRINCQDAAQYLGVSVKTIRHWAQTGKLTGKKIGTRGDWRFTKEELSKSVFVDPNKYESIKKFISQQAETIQALANIKHIKYLGTKNATRKNLRRNREDYVEIVEAFAKYLSQPIKGQKVFEKIGEKIAKESVEQALTLEETLDGTTFLKQSFWEKLESSGLLFKLTPHDLYTFNSVISQFTDIVTAKIVFAYEEHQNLQQAKLNQLEEARQSSEERFKMLADNIQNLAWMANADGYIYWYNKRWYDYTGKTPKDMEGWGWQSVHDPKILPAVLKRWKGSIKKGVALDMTFPLRGADGVFRPFLTRIMPVKNEEGTVIQWTGTNTDISDQVQAERSVANIIESMNDAFFQVDKNWKILNVNNGFENSAQTTRKKVIGKDFRKLFPETQQKDSEYYKNYLQTMTKQVPRHFVDYYEPLDLWTEVRTYPNQGGMSVFFKDVSDSKRSEYEKQELLRLEREKTELIKLNKVKDDFVAMASHQLRTPASIVKQYLGVLQAGYAGALTDAQQNYIRMANSANDREITIIEDLLKTAQIDSERYNLVLTKIDLVKMVQDVLKQYIPAFKAKNQQCVFNYQANKIVVQAAQAELNTCLSNLLENASKYSADGTTITIDASLDEEHANISVSDQGVGIAEQDYESIFNKFTRVNNPLSDTVTGSGLGLYWVKRVIELHNGTLNVRSKIGQGTTFSIGLPS